MSKEGTIQGSKKVYHKNNIHKEDNIYLSYHLSLFSKVFTERITIGPKRFTYFKNFAFCSFPGIKDNKNIFLSLHFILELESQFRNETEK